MDAGLIFFRMFVCLWLRRTSILKKEIKESLIEWAHKYNDPQYFQEDPIIFPKSFADKYADGHACLADIEIAAVLSSHLAWGRRAMIVRDCNRMFDEMCWKPYDYVMNGEYRNESVSLHRTIKWSEFAGICDRLRNIYQGTDSLENLSDTEFRVIASLIWSSNTICFANLLSYHASEGIPCGRQKLSEGFIFPLYFCFSFARRE